MKETSFQKTVRAFVRRRPFKPFVVELLSGDRFLVEHPEAVMVGTETAVYLNPDGDYAFFDSTAVTQVTEAVDNGSKQSRRRGSH